MKVFKSLAAIYCILISLSAFALNAFENKWALPITISEPGSSKPQVKTDPNGNTIVTWLESEGTNSNIRSRAFLKDQVWSEPMTISSFMGDCDHGVKLAMDKEGNAVLLWHEQMGNRKGEVKASRFEINNKNWMEPVTLSDSISLSKGAEVIVDSAGNILTLWVDEVGNMQAAPFIDGVWGSAMDFEHSNTVLNAKVAVDHAGNAVAVWAETSINGEVFIKGARLPFKSNTWIPSIAPLSDRGASSPQVAMNKAGDAIAVWVSETGVIKSATLLAGEDAWSIPSANLSDEGASQPQIVIDNDGDITVVWTAKARTGTVIQSAVRSSAATMMGLFGTKNTWSRPVTLSARRDKVSDPQIAVDGSGSIVAVWRKILSDDSIVIQSRKFTKAEGWSGANNLSKEGEKAGIPEVSVDHSGNKVFVVWANEALGHIQVASLVLAAPIITSIVPNCGPADGPNPVPVIITGTNLLNANLVAFGANFGTTFTVDSDTQITVAVNGVPVANAGTVIVEVQTPGGISNGLPYTYTGPPTVTGVSPNSGSAGGGTAVQITGTNFVGVTAVNFGAGNPGTSVNVISSTQIDVVSPSSGGTNCNTVDIQVVTCGGTSAISANDKFSYNASAIITGIIVPNPTQPSAGQTMTISGSSFTGATKVTIGGTDVLPPFISISDSSIELTVPTLSLTTCGLVSVTVTTCAGTSNSVNFNYVVAAPTITNLTSPATVGSTMTITGTHLTGATAVTFGGTTAGTNLIVVSDTEITVTVPTIAGAANCSTQTVSVTTCAGTSTAANFTYVIGVPTISTVTSPAAVGSTMTITGTHLTGATAVTFGGTTAGTNVIVVSDTQITVTVPTISGAANCSTQTVTVTTCAGTSTPATNFTYVTGAPTITNLTSPATVGSTMTITGTHLTGATAVTFGGTTAGTNLIVVSDTQITVTVPTIPGAANCSMQSVTVTTCGGTSTPANFSYVIGVPTISTVTSPATVGSTMTITGTHLTGATAVTFGGTAAGTNLIVVSDTQITVTVPTISGAANCSTQTVTVTTCAGTSTAANFTYVVGVPTISTVTSPATVGSTMTITGTHLTGATAVTFGGTTVGTNLIVVSDTQITVTVPTISGAANCSMQSVTVTTCAGTSTPANFTYVIGMPTISNVTSPATVGQTMTITGTHLTGATAVTFGGTTAGTNLIVVSDTEITVTVPTIPGAANCSTQTVTVTTCAGTSTAANFTYVAGVPTISNVTSPEAAGQTMTITGTHLTGATAVTFGGTTAGTNLIVVSDTQITVTVPTIPNATNCSMQSVTVTTCAGDSTPTNFMYVIGMPTVSNVTNPATVGQTMTINGQFFTGATQVTFGGTTAGTNLIVVSDTQITVTVPTIPGAVNCSMQNVTVTTCDGTSTPPVSFTYISEAAPTISSVTSPAAVGDTVTINGMNLNGTSTVKFGTMDGTNVTVVNDGEIQVTVPEASNCTVDVTVTSCVGTSNALTFNYSGLPAPTVTGISPNPFGPSTGGNTVTINGTNFMDVSSVTFGGVAATITGFTNTSINVIVPAGVAGTVSVTVTGCSGSGSGQYTYQNNVPNAPSNFRGFIKQNIFLNTKECILQASWTASTSTNVVEYKIYKKNKVIAKISARSRLFFEEKLHNCSAKDYSISAVNAAGQESARVALSLVSK